MSTHSRTSLASLNAWPARPSPIASRVPRALLRGRGNVFQRLDDLADLFAAHASNDLRTALGPRWEELRRAWAGRHLYVHNDGVVDGRYTRAVPAMTLQLGQRLLVTRTVARAAIENVRILVETLISS